MRTREDGRVDPATRRSNIRIAWVLALVAIAFFVGFMLMVGT